MQSIGSREHRAHLAISAKGQVAETDGVGASRLAQEAPQSLPGARPQDRKQIQVVCQALGRHHSWGVSATPQKRGSGDDSVMNLAAGLRADEAVRRSAHREAAGGTECRNPIQRVLAADEVHGSQLCGADDATAERSPGVGL